MDATNILLFVKQRLSLAIFADYRVPTCEADMFTKSTWNSNEHRRDE